MNVPRIGDGGHRPPSNESVSHPATENEQVGAAAGRRTELACPPQCQVLGVFTLRHVLLGMAIATIAVTSRPLVLTTDDEAALRDVTMGVKLMGPIRITRIGDVPLLPPRPRIRERANRLIHSLGGIAAQAPDPSDADEVDAGDADGQPADR